MGETQALGVQLQSIGRIIGRAVALVPDDGKAEMSRVRADLVGSSGLESGFEQARALVVDAQRSKVGDGGLPARVVGSTTRTRSPWTTRRGARQVMASSQRARTESR